MHPFGNQVVLREYTGEQILDALEHGVAENGGGGPHLLQVAGLRYVVDAERPAGSRVIAADIVDEEGGLAPLDLKARLCRRHAGVSGQGRRRLRHVEGRAQ